MKGGARLKELPSLVSFGYGDSALTPTQPIFPDVNAPAGPRSIPRVPVAERQYQGLCFDIAHRAS